MGLIGLAERGLVPDACIRAGIRRLDRKRLAAEAARGPDALSAARRLFEDQMRQSPIALQTERPRAQHYDIPPAFFRKVLGRRLKYSSGYWPEGVGSLDGAEEAMLALYCKRAALEDGQEVLKSASELEAA